MWIVVRFALLREADYGAAFELLARCGLRPLRAPRPRDPGPYPAAALARLEQDPPLVTRAVFERLARAGLAPLAVMASPVDVTRPANSPPALARA